MANKPFHRKRFLSKESPRRKRPSPLKRGAYGSANQASPWGGGERSEPEGVVKK